MRSKFINVTIDLNRIAAAAEAVKQRTGVRLIAVIKADAYGLGGPQVADALASIADDFAYFALEEAREIRRPGIVLGPPDGEPEDYRELNLRPMINNVEDARRYAGLPVAIAVDTGMQRFGAAAEWFDELWQITRADEAFGHGINPTRAATLSRVCGDRAGFRHFACTGMLDYPETYLDAVRPGLALYVGAVRVTTRLTHVRDLRGPAGYTGFQHPRIGLFPAGYCEGVGPAPVIVNGRRQRLIEVNMNASYVTLAADDQVGDEVVLLGDGLQEVELAAHFDIREHEVLCRYTSMGLRQYVGEAAPRCSTSVSVSASPTGTTPRRAADPRRT